MSALTGSGEPRWEGPPVDCAQCSAAGVPVLTEDGWRLPVHRRYAGLGHSERCGGSYAAVRL